MPAHTQMSPVKSSSYPQMFVNQQNPSLYPPNPAVHQAYQSSYTGMSSASLNKMPPYSSGSNFLQIQRNSYSLLDYHRPQSTNLSRPVYSSSGHEYIYVNRPVVTSITVTSDHVPRTSTHDSVGAGQPGTTRYSVITQTVAAQDDYGQGKKIDRSESQSLHSFFCWQYAWSSTLQQVSTIVLITVRQLCQIRWHQL